MHPIYDHSKSREQYLRASKVIPSGVYGHLGPSEGLFLPLEKWPLISSRAKAPISGIWTVIGIWTLCAPTVPMFWAMVTRMLTVLLWSS